MVIAVSVFGSTLSAGVVFILVSPGCPYYWDRWPSLLAVVIIGVDGRSGGEMGTSLLMPQSSCLAGDNVGESGEWGKEPLTIAGGEVMLSSSCKGGDEGGGTALVVIIVEPHC